MAWSRSRALLCIAEASAIPYPISCLPWPLSVHAPVVMRARFLRLAIYLSTSQDTGLALLCALAATMSFWPSEADLVMLQDLIPNWNMVICVSVGLAMRE